MLCNWGAKRALVSPYEPLGASLSSQLWRGLLTQFIHWLLVAIGELRLSLRRSAACGFDNDSLKVPTGLKLANNTKF